MIYYLSHLDFVLKNVATDKRITRQLNLLDQEKPRTKSSSKLPRHNLKEYGTK